MSQRPLVSIIVPSYNQGRFIRRTLESIFKQDYRPIEVLVIDGASTDETVAILKEYSRYPELHWVSEPDRGVVDAVNKGLARATGQIGAIQSSDDFYLPGAIMAAVAALLADPRLAFVFGDIKTIDADGKELHRTHLGPFSPLAVFALDVWIPQPSTFFRLDIAKEMGGWRESVPYAADTDLWLRMALKHPAQKIDVLMAERSIHEAQRDKQGKRIAYDYGQCIDTLPGLSDAPAGVRRAAQASKYLVQLRYDPNVGEWTRVGRYWRAAFAWPRLFWRHSPYQYFPYGPYCRALPGRMARALGLR